MTWPGPSPTSVPALPRTATTKCGPARAELERDGGRVEEDRVTLRDRPDQGRVREGRGRQAVDLDGQLLRPGPLGHDTEHHAFPEPDHLRIIIARMHPLERLLNLVALLLDTRRPLTFDEIRDRVPAYGQGDEASAKRMFERDKDTLREAGIPVELESTDAWDVEKGYRIPHEAYYLPAIAFSQDELWALFVAAHTPGSDGEAEMAFQKLSSGADTDVLPILAAGEPTPGVDVSGPHLATVADALARRRALRFRYRPLHGPNRSAHRGSLRPASSGAGAGTWSGNDRERKGVRSFRLSRVQAEMRDAGEASPAPEGFDAASHLESGPWGIGKPARDGAGRLHAPDRVVGGGPDRRARTSCARAGTAGWRSRSPRARRRHSSPGCSRSAPTPACSRPARSGTTSSPGWTRCWRAMPAAPSDRRGARTRARPAPHRERRSGCAVCWRPSRTSFATQACACPRSPPCSAWPSATCSRTSTCCSCPACRPTGRAN